MSKLYGKAYDGTKASVEGANKCSARVEQEICCEKWKMRALGKSVLSVQKLQRLCGFIQWLKKVGKKGGEKDETNNNVQ